MKEREDDLEEDLPRKRRRWPTALLLIGIVVIVFTLFLRTFIQLPQGAWSLDEGDSGGNPISNFFSSLMSGNDEGKLPSVSGSNRKAGVYTFLLCGTDKGNARTDTIMVASLDTVNHTMGLISIPRDTYIASASRSVKKINGAYGDKNIDRLLEEVGTVVGFRPDYWLMVDLAGFVALVDAIGGVDFDVPQDLKYSDPDQNLYINIKKGEQHLDGEAALKVARYRKGYANADLRRVEVQRDLMTAVAKKVFSPGSLIKIPALKNAITDNLETDLEWGNILAFALELAKVDMDTGAAFGTLPTTGKSIKGGSYQQVAKKEAVILVNETVNPFKEPLTVDAITS